MLSQRACLGVRDFVETCCAAAGGVANGRSRCGEGWSCCILRRAVGLRYLVTVASSKSMICLHLRLAWPPLIIGDVLVHHAAPLLLCRHALTSFWRSWFAPCAIYVERPRARHPTTPLASSLPSRRTLRQRKVLNESGEEHRFRVQL